MEFLFLPYTDQLDKIVESIFVSYLNFDEKYPNEPFWKWSRNKNARKKFKTLSLYTNQNGKCFHCEQMIKYDAHYKSNDKNSLDRVIPGSSGGSYKIENLVLSCLGCNKQRGNKTIDEYINWKQGR